MRAGPGTWCTSTSRRSGGSPTAACGRCTAGDRLRTKPPRSASKRNWPGYTFLHTAIDGYSRLAYIEALPDKKAVAAIGFIFRSRAFFAAHGIVRVGRIVTDNGACYKAKDFAKVLLGVRHQRITPYTPRHNWKVERYNRILAEEFLYAREWTSDLQRKQALQVH